MNNIITKLQSKRGVSIMLALLLFLICILAGTAALTAARANIGRHRYMRESQQQYLAVSSAAKLIREQLDGMEVRAKYTFKADTWDIPDEIYNPLGDYHVLTGQVDDPIFEYYLDGTLETTTDNIILKFFVGDTALKGMLKRAVYEQISQPGIPWQEAMTEPTTPITNEYDFTIACDDIDGDVNVHLEIVDANGPYTADKSFKVTVTSDDYDYYIVMKGSIDINVPTPSITATTPIEIELYPVLFPGLKYYYERIDECAQLDDTIVKFSVEETYTREAKTAGGGDAP